MVEQVRGELLDAIIVKVRHEYIFLWVEGDAGDHGESTIEWADDVHHKRSAPRDQAAQIGRPVSAAQTGAGSQRRSVIRSAPW